MGTAAWIGPAFVRTVLKGHPFVVLLLPFLAVAVLSVFIAGGSVLGQRIGRVVARNTVRRVRPSSAPRRSVRPSGGQLTIWIVCLIAGILAGTDGLFGGVISKALPGLMSGRDPMGLPHPVAVALVPEVFFGGFFGSAAVGGTLGYLIGRALAKGLGHRATRPATSLPILLQPEKPLRNPPAR